MTASPVDSAASARLARTIFFGSGRFAVPCLEALAGHPAVRLVGVVTPPDRPSGRRGQRTPVPVAAAARRHGLRLLQPEEVRTAAVAASLGELDPDLGVLADFGRIIPPAILDLPRHGILNVHPSLLPRHRGASPIPATILAGDPVAGVSLMRMDAGLDTGPVIGSRSWALSGVEVAPELEARAAVEGAELLAELLGPYLRGECPPIPQDDARSTRTRPLRRSDGLLDPSRPAVELERQVRAYIPWPGSWLAIQGRRVVVLRTAVAPREAADQIGLLVADGAGLALVAADGRLRLLEVQPAGGRPMPAAAFLRGHAAVIGQVIAGAS